MWNNNQYDYDNGDSYKVVGQDKDFAKEKVTVANRIIAKSFLFMMIGLLITGGAVLFTPLSVVLSLVKNTFLIVIAQIALAMGGTYAISHNKSGLAALLFAGYSYLMGIIVFVITIPYTQASIESAFFTSAAMFAVTAIAGLITKKDLTSIGSMCIMTLFGVVIARIINIFIGGTGMDFALSVISVIVFVGLTAYDSQKMKQMAYNSSEVGENRLALYCGFELYLDFINLFLNLLRIFGKKK